MCSRHSSSSSSSSTDWGCVTEQVTQHGFVHTLLPRQVLLLQAESIALTETEVKRAEAAALLERRMAAMEAVLAARRNPPAQAVEPQAARGPGADLRFQVKLAICRKERVKFLCSDTPWLAKRSVGVDEGNLVLYIILTSWSLLSSFCTAWSMYLVS